MPGFLSLETEMLSLRIVMLTLLNVSRHVSTTGKICLGLTSVIIVIDGKMQTEGSNCLSNFAKAFLISLYFLK